MFTQIWKHGFIVATSFAAFVHSTWTFGTLFSGKHPIVTGETLFQYLMWVAPAALVALAIDIGQIQTSIKISQRKTDRGMLYVTFFILAGAMFYLQAFHIAHHMPALEFGDGLSASMRPVMQFAKDLSVIIIPLMLPLSILLYTFSIDHETVTDVTETDKPKRDKALRKTEPKALHVTDEPAIQDDDTQPAETVRTCQHCEKPLPETSRKNAKYCNAKCRQAYHRQNANVS